jgi:chromosome segregation ATPase
MCKKFMFTLILGLGIVAAVMASRKYDLEVSAKKKEKPQPPSPSRTFEPQIQAQRALLAGLDSEIKKYLHDVAIREVEVRNLEKDLADTRSRQEENKKHIQAVRDDLKGGDVSKVSTKSEAARARQERELGRLLGAFKRCEEDLKTKEAKLEAYRDALEAAHDELVAYQSERRDQEIELARLEASVAKMRVEEVKTAIPFDRSKLAEIKKNIDALRNKLEVRQKELELQGRYLGTTRPATPTKEPNRDVLAEADELLGAGAKSATDK